MSFRRENIPFYRMGQGNTRWNRCYTAPVPMSLRRERTRSCELSCASDMISRERDADGRRPYGCEATSSSSGTSALKNATLSSEVLLDGSTSSPSSSSTARRATQLRYTRRATQSKMPPIVQTLLQPSSFSSAPDAFALKDLIPAPILVWMITLKRERPVQIT